MKPSVQKGPEKVMKISMFLAPFYFIIFYPG